MEWHGIHEEGRSFDREARTNDSSQGAAMNVAVLGASNKPDRYSYKAVKKLSEKGHVPLTRPPDPQGYRGHLRVQEPAGYHGPSRYDHRLFVGSLFERNRR